MCCFIGLTWHGPVTLMQPLAWQQRSTAPTPTKPHNCLHAAYDMCCLVPALPAQCLALDVVRTVRRMMQPASATLAPLGPPGSSSVSPRQPAAPVHSSPPAGKAACLVTKGLILWPQQ